jgi:hypothetical protein
MAAMGVDDFGRLPRGGLAGGRNGGDAPAPYRDVLVVEEAARNDIDHGRVTDQDIGRLRAAGDRGRQHGDQRGSYAHLSGRG